jgi:hypothetical protein
VLGRRGIAVSDAVRERVMGCADLGVLREYLARAVTATSAEELFADSNGTPAAQDPGDNT